MAKRTITINGRLYDAVTGLPVKASAAKPIVTPKPVTPANPAKPAGTPSRGQAAADAVHSSLQRSVTLARRAAKKPVTSVHKIVRRPQAGRSMDIAAKPNLRKFSPNPVVPKPSGAKPAAPKAAAAKPAAKTLSSRLVPKPVRRPAQADTPAQVHPLAARASAKAAAKQQAAQKAVEPKTSKQVKDAAIAKALETAKPAAKPSKKKTNKKLINRSLFIGGILLIILLGLFAVYRFVPSVSVSLAASQAGVDAQYPSYVPDGFALEQPVSYSDGEVALTFASNSNEDTYTISQKRSSWDSSAVLDNVVTPLVGDNYTTTQERGLKIFTYANGAAWVNGGVLYTISGEATLSNDQVRRIATGL